MKHIYITCVCMMLFLLMACTEDHSFTLDEKRQIIVVNNLLALEIGADSSQIDGEHLFFITKVNLYDTKELDTIKLHGQSTGLYIKKGDSSGYKKTLRVNLRPNRKYTITHSGMGGRVFIQEFYYTDSKGILRVDRSRKRKVGYRDT